MVIISKVFSTSEIFSAAPQSQYFKIDSEVIQRNPESQISQLPKTTR